MPLKLIKTVRLFTIWMVIPLWMVVSLISEAETVTFNKSLLWGGASGSISYEDREEGIRPAKFKVNKRTDVYLDGVSYKKNVNNQKIEPCLTTEQMYSLSINTKHKNETCQFLGDLDKNIELSYDYNDGIYILQLPQYLMIKEANDVDSSQWSYGDTAFVWNYYTNVLWNNYGDARNTSMLANSDWKLNLDSGYFLRGDLNLDVNDNQKNLKNNYIYLQKDIKPIQSTVLIGNLNNNAFYFDAYKFNGITFENKKEMWAESALRYRPAISGVVSTPSIIEVYQGDTLIKRVEVQTGRYNITDYNPIYYGGEFKVVVKNLNGVEIDRYDLPYTPGDIFINKNNFLYSLNIGQFDQKKFEHQNVYQAGFLYGINDYLNLKQGYLYTPRYFSVNYGLLFNTFLGLFQMDINAASAKPVTETKSFSRYETGLSYRKSINSRYLSNIVTRYNYSANNYYSLNDSYDRYNSYRSVKGDSYIQLNGALYGSSLALTFGHKNFWNSNEIQNYLSLGITNNYRSFVYDVYASKTDNDFNLNVGFQMPLGNQYRSSYLYTSYNYSDNYGNSENINYNTELTPSLNAGISVYRSKDNDNIAGTLNYRGEYFDVAQSIMSISSSEFSYTGSVNGSFIVIDHNLLPLRRLSDTVAIIKSENLENAKINNSSNHINKDGYGPLSVSPYKKNKISLSSENTPLNVSSSNLIHEVIPVRGSISLVKFETKKSNSVFLEFDKEIIDKVIFSDNIFDMNNHVIAAFSQGNYVFVKNYNNENTIKFYIKNKLCEVNVIKTDGDLLNLPIYKVSTCINAAQSL